MMSVNTLRNKMTGNWKGHFFGQGVKVAAPSFVWPDHVAGNCLRLQGIVDEVGLLFLESESCLAYTDADLPPYLQETGLRFHVHLPVDLPWGGPPRPISDIMVGLRKKAEFLDPWAFVLHPPPVAFMASRNDTQFNEPLTSVLDLWLQAGARNEDLLLENVRENDLIDLWPLIQSRKLGICLDLGHLLAYGQRTHLLPGIWPHVRMVHLSAPGPHGEHRSLRDLDVRGLALLEEILRRVDSECVLMVELFDPRIFLESLDMLLTTINAMKVCVK